MPYIKQELKNSYSALEKEINKVEINKGGMNYLFHLIIKRFMGGNINYDTISDVISGLECAKLEYYRRLATAYEDTKIIDNGDVPPYTLFIDPPGITILK